MSDQITVKHDNHGNLTHIYIPNGTFTCEEVFRIIEANIKLKQFISNIPIVGGLDPSTVFVEQINIYRRDARIFGSFKHTIIPHKNKPYYRQFDKKNKY